MMLATDFILFSCEQWLSCGGEKTISPEMNRPVSLKMV